MGNEFEPYQERRPPGLASRFIETSGQIFGLALGGGLDYVRRKKELGEQRSLGILLLRLFLALTWPFLDKRIVRLPFSIQFRLRMEKMGPTYIKLGQILSLREDLLPKTVTDELKRLLDQLPAVSYERFKELIVESLELPVNMMYRWIDPAPLGSASLAQTHRARLVTNEKVVIKVLKPGVRILIERDTRLLRFFGRFLQLFLARYQPARIINEFSDYTLREVDLRFEADNAETFAAYFQDEPKVRFPRIYRKYSSRDVLCMEYFGGIKPDENALKKMANNIIETSDYKKPTDEGRDIIKKAVSELVDEEKDRKKIRHIFFILVFSEVCYCNIIAHKENYWLKKTLYPFRMAYTRAFIRSGHGDEKEKTNYNSTKHTNNCLCY